eukprot:TRINITY_DN7269_c0_g1_i1.p2 TRINITY_DN7269_c0_g1~~TRINITY_DN7269_c0_g1_i1.p2  ORF type:complete len:180 (+),score=55.53 TRINITY_DN7269_c0_g1_i1:124-663(+)
MLRCFSRLQATCSSAISTSSRSVMPTLASCPVSGTDSVGGVGVGTGLGSALSSVLKRWATSKAGGTTKNGRKAQPKYLGLKKSDNQKVLPGHIIIRQRGTEFHPGRGVGIGRDHTIYALVPGVVRFTRSHITEKRYINVVSQKEHDELAGIIARDRARRNIKWQGMLRAGDQPELYTTV